MLFLHFYIIFECRFEILGSLIRSPFKKYLRLNLILAQALGKMGRVQIVYSDGDLRVCVSGQTWTFNPACCSAAPHAQQELNNTMSEHQREEPSSK